MKRFLHALAALWPERREPGSPPLLDTRTGILQHWAAVLRMDGILSGFADLHNREIAKDTVGAGAPGEFVRSEEGLNISKREQSKFANSHISESATQPNNLTHISRPMPLLTIVIPVIFMCLMAAKQVSAQAEPAAAAAIKPLQIGDTIPEELWHLPLQVVNHPEGKDTITLNDYRGKLIILDFWATWCVPCISSLYKLDVLQDQFADDLAVIPTTYEQPEKVAKLFQGKGWGLPSATTETTLKKYFPHRSVPHQIWLMDERIRGIVHGEDATIENIIKLRNDDTFTIHTKRDILDYNLTSHILTYAEQTSTALLSMSTITEQIAGTPSLSARRKSKERLYINFMNVNPLLIYATTIGAPNNRIKVLSDRFERLDNENIYCYQLITAGTSDEQSVQRRILSDLNAHFSVQLDSVVMEMDCYVISRQPDFEERRNAMRGASLSGQKTTQNFQTLISLLNFSGRWKASQSIFIDESGYTGDIKAEPYTLLQSNIDILRATLSPYGLSVRRGIRPVKMFIITNPAES